MKTLQTVTLLALATTALAQGQQTGIEKGTFGMAKATLEFLATDTKTFPKAQETTCKDCVEYGDLSAFIQKNSLKKADGLLNDIQKHSLKLNDGFAADEFSSEGAVLDSLRQYILNRVTSGSERAHRKQLASYVAYQTKMTALAGGADPEAALNEQTAALQEGSTPTDDAEAASTSSTGSFGWGTRAFWLSILNLLGLGYLLVTRQQGGGNKGAVQSDRDDARIAGLQDENNRLSSTVAELANRLTMAEKKLMAMQSAQAPQNRPPADRPNVPQGNPTQATSNPIPANQPRPIQGQGYGNQPNPSAMPMSGSSQMSAPNQPATPTPPPSNVRPTPTIPPLPGNVPGERPAVERPVSSEMPSPQPVPAPPAMPAAPPAPKRLYARTADLGNGFSLAGLLDQPERGIVYEIELTSPSTAMFRVSQLPEAQQLAMSDPYSYLSDACLYENQPGPNSRIQTVAPGQLVLQADKWQITDKARIGFV
ncbi:hypothetical protein ACAW74_22225 [Fibrella sp. WM1]|uniref:hypothetical protein n=1 Tax=Fibrella musci TaxID=3242485 RepID=UPI003520670C